jgi:hypothetical protein
MSSNIFRNKRIINTGNVVVFTLGLLLCINFLFDVYEVPRFFINFFFGMALFQGLSTVIQEALSKNQG